MRDQIRAITVKQPWAWAIAHAGKTIENRSRGTSYRGTLAIHAGAAWSDRGMRDRRLRDVWDAAGLPRLMARGAYGFEWFPSRNEVIYGSVIAVADLVDSHPDAGCCRPWGESDYRETSGRRRTVVHHLVLEGIRPVPDPVPCRGALGLWWLPEDVAADLLNDYPTLEEGVTT